MYDKLQGPGESAAEIHAIAGGKQRCSVEHTDYVKVLLVSFGMDLCLCQLVVQTLSTACNCLTSYTEASTGFLWLPHDCIMDPFS